MAFYILRRSLLALFSCLVISFISFVVVQLPPGDYADYFAEAIMGRTAILTSGLDQCCTQEQEDQFREDLGLNQPFLKQYWDWVSGMVLRADFGDAQSVGLASLSRPVREIIIERLGVTVALGLFTILITWTLSVPIGIYSAVRHHSIGDYAFTFLGFTGMAVPDFLLGLVLLYIFFAYFEMSVGGLFSGDYTDAAWSLGKVWDLIKHMFIPAIVLGTSGTAALVRIMRNNLLDELGKPYVVTAMAKGLPHWKAIVKYPARVAINPLVSGMGAILPALVGGSIIVSWVLSLPTLGVVLLEALRIEDVQLSGTMILLMGVLTVVGVFVSDLLLVVIDPRIRLTGPRR